MMYVFKEFIFIGTMAVFVGISCSSVLKSNGTAGDDLVAQTLVAFGRETNDSVLTMIGRIIENYHMCTPWSEWTACGAMSADFFSTRTRARHCGKDVLENDSPSEIETGVCEGDANNLTENECPTNYEMTTNGFCLRLHTTKKTHDEAEIVCINEGGFLINIDSDSKHADMMELLTNNVISENIHINGRRKNSASQWEYSYGGRSGYFHWYSGYPVSTETYLCLALTGYRTTVNQRFLTFNSPCHETFSFVCEIATI